MASEKYHFASLIAILSLFIPLASEGYIGPGVGLSAIGTLIALVLVVLAAVVGFVWFPLKRWLKKRKDQRPNP